MSTPVSAHLLDELNELFLSQVWQLVDDNQDGMTSAHSFSNTPTYEKEVPEDLLHPQPAEPEKTLVMKQEDIRFSDIVGQHAAVNNLRMVVKQFRNPQHLRMLGGTNKKRYSA